MPELRYPKPYRFEDRDRGETYNGPGVFDVPADAVDQYLERGWEEADDEADSESASDAEVDESQAEQEDDDAIVYEDLTVSELEETLNTREFSEDELREMLEHEQENKGRKGATELLESELSDSDAESESESDATESGE